MKKIMSIDAETNGLWGKPFAVAGILYEKKPRKTEGYEVVEIGGFKTGERYSGDPERFYRRYHRLEPIVVEESVWKEIDRIIVRISDVFITDEWTLKNVIPTLENVGVTHETYEDMLETFSKWYCLNKEGSEVLYHMGHIVESYLFREMHRLGFIGNWDAPYTPIEVSEVLRQKGYRPDSVDDMQERKIW